MKKRTACITGASSGIGYEMAKKLSALGYDLILVARNTKALKSLLHLLTLIVKYTHVTYQMEKAA